MAKELLQVTELSVEFIRRGERLSAVNGVSFGVVEGEAVGFVGASGSGKSVTARAIMRLSPPASAISVGGSIRFYGTELLTLGESEMRDIRGSQIAMVFQDPMASLNPVMTVGAQIIDMLQRHTGRSRRTARARAIELLSEVGIREPHRRIDDYPHEFSGGMRQRVLIAIAVSCEPKLLIADEATTALDVTVQAQILRLIARLRTELGMALLLITHNFGVVAGMVDRVYVMNHGSIVEAGAVDDLFTNPRDPYTRLLLNAVPRIDGRGRM